MENIGESKRYSVDEAEREADRLKRLVGAGEAADYAEAEKIDAFNKSRDQEYSILWISNDGSSFRGNAEGVCQFNGDYEQEPISEERRQELIEGLQKLSLRADALPDEIEVVEIVQELGLGNNFSFADIKYLEQLAGGLNPKILKAFNKDALRRLNGDIGLLAEKAEGSYQVESVFRQYIEKTCELGFPLGEKEFIEIVCKISGVADAVKDELLGGKRNLESVEGTIMPSLAAWLVTKKSVPVELEGFIKKFCPNTLAVFGSLHHELVTHISKGKNPNILASMPDLHAAQRLEEESPGSVKALMEEFGIIYFGRYPHEALIAQVKNLNKPDLDYGILIYPYVDHNGAFDKDAQTIRSVTEQLRSEGVTLMFSEAGSDFSVLRRMLAFKKRFNKGEGARVLIIGGHGSKTGINFGDGEDEGSRISIEEVSGPGVKRALGEGFLREDATIVLFSCSTGKQGGIAEKISEAARPGTKVIAPTEPTSVKSMRVTKDGERLKFEVSYRDDVGTEFVAA